MPATTTITSALLERLAIGARAAGASPATPTSKMPLDAVARQLGGQRRLLGDRDVGGAGADDRDRRRARDRAPASARRPPRAGPADSAPRAAARSRSPPPPARRASPDAVEPALRQLDSGWPRSARASSPRRAPPRGSRCAGGGACRRARTRASRNGSSRSCAAPRRSTVARPRPHVLEQRSQTLGVHAGPTIHLSSDR